MEMGEILLKVASEARTRKKTEDRGSDLLDLLEKYSNGRTVDGFSGKWSNPYHLVPGVSSYQRMTQWKEI